MAIYKENIVDIELNSGNIHRSFMNHSIGSGDAAANRFGVRVVRNGEAVNLTGVSCFGYFRNAEGTNIALTSEGTVSGNVAYVTLPQACYNVEGNFTLAIKLVGGGITGTMRIVDGVVDNTNTGGAVAPTQDVPTYTEILAVYDQMQDAVEDYTETVTGQNEKIANIKSALMAVENKITDESSAILTKISGEAVQSTTGEIVENESYARTDFVDIYKSGAFRVIANDVDKLINYCVYDDNKQYITGVNMASEDDSGWVEISDKARYVIISFYDAYDITDFAILMQDYESPTYQNHNNIKKTIEQAVVGSQFPNNLCDPLNYVDGWYVATLSGELVRGDGYFATSMIPVEGGVTYRANHGRNLAWYDSDMEYISGESGTGIQTGVTAPDDAAYIRFTINKTSDNLQNPIGLYFAKSSKYDGTVSIPGLVGTVAWCYGKKINWIGDSIVDGRDFDEEVCEALGLVKENEYGINGSTIALKGDGTDGRNALCVRYAQMSDNADIIAVSCGTNDFEYAWCPIGTLDDPDDGTSNTTFYGALKTLCKGLIDKYPKKVIFFTTPIKRAQPFADGAGGTYTQDGVMTTPFSKNKYGKTLMDYADIIKEVCGYYSIPVLDMYRESMLNPHIPSQQDMFDNVYTHPNTTGQKIMARRVSGWMTQLGYTIQNLS